jgi:UDP-N-acetyl-D-mannosaminuronate dehydrogenase
LDKIEGKNVLVLGKSYKSALPETRGSPGLALTEVLREKGYNVVAYDPKFDTAIPKLNPDTVIVTVAEPEFRNLAAITGKEARAVLDYAGVLDRANLPKGTRLWQAGRGWINV